MRNPFRRGVEVPAEVVARAGLGRGEKVLAGARTGDGGWLLGTRDVLLVVPASGAQTVTETGAAAAVTRIPWQRVETADWKRDDEQLRVVEVGDFGRVRPVHTFSIGDPGLLVELVRERVTASVVLQRRVVVEGKRGLYVIARRAPRGDGEVTWVYEFDPGIDPEDPAVTAAAGAGLVAAQEELGL